MRPLSNPVLTRLDPLVSWFAPASDAMDQRLRGPSRMLVYVCLINLVFCLLYTLTSLFVGFYTGALLMSTGIALLFANLFYFRAGGRLRLSVNLYMANCVFVAVLGCSFFSGGLYSPVMPWFVLVPVVAVLLLGYSVDAFVWMAVCIAIPLAYGVAALQGYQFPVLYWLDQETAFRMICIGGLVAVLFLFALTFDHNSNVAMQQVLESRRELERLARIQERVAERSRILRNMHDGVGAHISSAMRQLQAEGDSGDFAVRAEVLQTLRDGMDHLKLSIDAIHLVPGDVTALLANMRYRLGPRFAAMGIEMQWDVELLPISQSLDASAMSELQFMLFEAMSNVLQHSHARVLRIEGHTATRGVVAPATADAMGMNHIFVRVIDDGCGFDPLVGTRNGLGAMRERAASIGAQLCVASKPGRTVVEIKLPG